MTGSTWMTRWGLTLGVLWSQVLLSAWVHTEKIPPGANETGRLVGLLLGGPLASLLILLMFRFASDRKRPTRSADLLILWVMTFLFGGHAALLAVGLGILSSMTGAIPGLLGGLFLGLGPILMHMEAGCPLGIQTPKTQRSAAGWFWVHRKAGLIFIGAGIITPLGLWFAPALGLGWTLAMALVAGGSAVTLGFLVPSAVLDEQNPAAPRPSEASAEQGGGPQT